jgi:tetratricopeptide (TPR) repeat protein
MKKILSLIAVLAVVTTTQAQSEKYTKAMQSNVVVLDSLHTAETWTDAANTFQRIADAEKTQWLPYYYAALGNVMTGYMLSGQQAGADKIDPLADKAEEMLNKADALSKDNAEIWCVKKMIASLRLMADPMNRYMTYGPKAAEALQKAKSLNPENPRVYLLEGQDKFYTPEQFGGSKTEAKALFELALKKYDSAKPESDIHPNWGRSQVKYFLDQVK